jgi:glycine/D-amino acid oxidase-like deaminating enzyme
MNDYRKYSFWLETAGESLTPRAPLRSSENVDIAILGGGYSGLWTAYYLLRANPDLRIAILDKEIVGFGASGRNGGWCSSRFPVSPTVLRKRFGDEVARKLLLAMFDAVDEVGQVCSREGIAADFRKGGILTVARGAHQEPSLHASYRGYASLGLESHFQLLSTEQCRERVSITKVCGGLYSPRCGSIHPAKLARGLARVLENRGVTIYEQTEVTNVVGGAESRLVTRSGELCARQGVLLAGEAYVTRLPRLHRALLPMYSLISVTEPLTTAQWATIGWQNCESLASYRLTVDYLTRTADGRILFGSRGAPYQFGSLINDDQDRHEPTHSRIHQFVEEWFPTLRGIQFTHNWGGPVGVPRDWMPTARFDPRTRIGFVGGYTGQGVATSNLAGRVLAALLTEPDSTIARLPVAQRRSPNWEIEPLRWLVVRYMQNAFQRIDEALESGRPRPLDAKIVEALGRH